MARKALICGISGQDGAYLSQLLLDKGYEVWGTSRDANSRLFSNLQALGLADRVKLLSMSVTDFRSVLQALQKVQPDEVYNLSGQSSVGLSFEQPVETFDSIGVGTLNLLEALRFHNPKIRFYNAGSGECYGDTGGVRADENTLFRPSSPYAVAKSTAFWTVANYREAYGLYACTGILFNHESPLRPQRFVTRKIVAAACRIAAGAQEKLRLGNLEIIRDWGWAPEYVDAMWRMLQQPGPPVDVIVATGHSYSLADFVEAAFAAVGLDWTRHVQSDAALMRPTDHLRAHANPERAEQRLEWRAQSHMLDVVRAMVAAERERLDPPRAPPPSN
jgi:GDPmannose 4,6-dehydratase